MSLIFGVTNYKRLNMNNINVRIKDYFENDNKIWFIMSRLF